MADRDHRLTRRELDRPWRPATPSPRRETSEARPGRTPLRPRTRRRQAPTEDCSKTTPVTPADEREPAPPPARPDRRPVRRRCRAVRSCDAAAGAQLPAGSGRRSPASTCTSSRRTVMQFHLRPRSRPGQRGVRPVRARPAPGPAVSFRSLRACRSACTARSWRPRPPAARRTRGSGACRRKPG